MNRTYITQIFRKFVKIFIQKGPYSIVWPEVVFITI